MLMAYKMYYVKLAWGKVWRTQAFPPPLASTSETYESGTAEPVIAPTVNSPVEALEV